MPRYWSLSDGELLPTLELQNRGQWPARGRSRYRIQRGDAADSDHRLRILTLDQAADDLPTRDEFDDMCEGARRQARDCGLHQ